MNKFEKLYMEDNQNWRDEVSSREEMNAYIDYKFARDGGKSHGEAMRVVAENAKEDEAMKAVLAKLGAEKWNEEDARYAAHQVGSW